jgi:hypothetical protein
MSITFYFYLCLLGTYNIEVYLFNFKLKAVTNINLNFNELFLNARKCITRFPHLIEKSNYFQGSHTFDCRERNYAFFSRDTVPLKFGL